MLQPILNPQKLLYFGPQCSNQWSQYVNLQGNDHLHPPSGKDQATFPFAFQVLDYSIS